MLADEIKYYLNDTFKLIEVRKIGLFEYNVELFRENKLEPWSTQIEDLYTLLVDLEETFEIVKLVNMESTDQWYYVTLYIYDEEFAYES